MDTEFWIDGEGLMWSVPGLYQPLPDRVLRTTVPVRGGTDKPWQTTLFMVANIEDHMAVLPPGQGSRLRRIVTLVPNP